MRVFRLLFPILVLLLLGGCNVLDGLEPDRLDDDPMALLEEGTFALQQGDPAEAERHLRRALELAPDHPVIPVKLSTALLAKHEVSILALTDMADIFTEEAEQQSSPQAHLRAQATAGGSVCSFPKDHAREAFDPRDIRNFPNFSSDSTTAALNEVQQLVNRVLARSETAPGAFDGSDIRATVDSLQAEGVSDLDIAEALVNNAVAYVTLAYLEVAASEEAFSFYRVYPGDGSTYVGYCATDQETLDRVKGQIACKLGDLDYARLLLRERARLLSTSTAEEVAGYIDEAYAALEANLDATCTGASN